MFFTIAVNNKGFHCFPSHKAAGAGSHDIDGSGGLLLPGFIDAHTHLGIIENGIDFEGDDCNEATDPVTEARFCTP